MSGTRCLMSICIRLLLGKRWPEGVNIGLICTSTEYGKGLTNYEKRQLGLSV